MVAASKLYDASATPRSAGEVEFRLSSTPLTAPTPRTPRSVGNKFSGPRIIIAKEDGAPVFSLPSSAAAKMMASKAAALANTDDPFVAPKLSLKVESLSIGRATEQKLSPTASSFTPSSPYKTGLPSPADSETSFGKKSGSVPRYMPGSNKKALQLKHVGNTKIVGNNTLAAPPTPSTGNSDEITVSGIDRRLLPAGGIGSTNDSSRALIIECVDSEGLKLLIDFINSRCPKDSVSDYINELDDKDRVLVSFYDIRESRLAHSYVKIYRPNWNVQYVLGLEAVKARALHGSTVLCEDGGILMTVRREALTAIEPNELKDFVLKAVRKIGEVCNHVVMYTSANIVRLYVDFFDIRAARNTRSEWDDKIVQGWHVAVELVAQSYFGREKSGGVDRSVDKGPEDKILSSQIDTLNAQLKNEVSFFHTSPIGQGPPPPTPVTNFNPPGFGFGYHQAPGAIGQERIQPYVGATPSSHGTHHYTPPPPRRDPYDNHNIVDIDRIYGGLDFRTTIMLRNIPNKIDQPLLKQIVDETSYGKYDFMYLRIDFANNCNVGYAFINFEDPLDIIDFVHARAGKRWNCFNSDKVAEVSYATIQGCDCLINKFRNSSVMAELPHFRPKLFKDGEEIEFPPVNNPSKMRRSLENASTTGLYAPRASRNRRDDQRRRNGQWDRGTTFAYLEDYARDQSNRQGHPEPPSPPFPMSPNMQEYYDELYTQIFYNQSQL